MRRIPLRHMPDPSDNSMLESSEIIRNVIRKPMDPQRGADIAEIRAGIRILDRLEACDRDALFLEDSDWQHLADKTRAMQWGLVDKRVLQFVDDVLEAHEVASDQPSGLLESMNQQHAAQGGVLHN